MTPFTCIFKEDIFWKELPSLLTHKHKCLLNELDFLGGHDIGETYSVRSLDRHHKGITERTNTSVTRAENFILIQKNGIDILNLSSFNAQQPSDNDDCQ